jgi:6-phosphofructokinase 1
VLVFVVVFSQIAQSSIMCIMAGYTNFAVGHLANKSAMISVDELILSESVTMLKEHEDIWQQTIMTTGQPRLLNDSYVINPRRP